MANIKLSQGHLFFKEARDISQEMRERSQALQAEVVQLTTAAMQTGQYDVRRLLVLTRCINALYWQSVYHFQTAVPPASTDERMLFQTNRR
jgi:hypothetical protein